ncbi:MAG: nucleotide exchange factor GrpE [Aurantimonas endophytica]|uniref:Protein GrpE n=1 Tax=Aurantimonas endophytica TaxID=1522175 RepID=A0A7W6HHU9_9HYPH|nr:nucleotide exchange factor GrpE [Aurantimonas endophytica]MBB4005484.1 molecular chaperone GrpE [Aurantimonas endophytica]MCO6405861.1 nucleotide exchange factor GrpE [Aurantimonas endophytica]
MTIENGQRHQSETDDAAGEARPGAAEDGHAANDAASETPAPSGFADPEAAAGADAERIARLEAENADVKDRLLRLAADMENLRRRTEREIKDARTYGVTGFAREMLSVADNLRRAIEAVPAEAKAHGDDGLNALIDGVEVTERSLISALEKHGVKRLDPEGQRFDPNFHQAMFEIPNPEVPHNTVLQVVQAGYAIGDRVLRPAMVGVSKGGPKQNAGEAKPAEGNGPAD